MSDELAERVERGAALLDERRPGWWDEVDLSKLDLNSCCRCVLGQLWGHYWRGAAELFGCPFYNADAAAGAAGFDAQDESHFPALTDLWRAAIERRRTQVPA
jgi:hypothetical protein